jgi:hypothetical protein
MIVSFFICSRLGWMLYSCTAALAWNGNFVQAVSIARHACDLAAVSGTLKCWSKTAKCSIYSNIITLTTPQPANLIVATHNKSAARESACSDALFGCGSQPIDRVFDFDDG